MTGTWDQERIAQAWQIARTKDYELIRCELVCALLEMKRGMTMEKSRIDWTDDVRGIIIGGDDRRYEFWTEERIPWQGIFPEMICRGSFPNDEEAIAWFKEKYPDHFRRGAEMRVYGE